MKKGFFAVSDGHKLHYELYGNPNGKPVMFLHGGPGVGFKEKDKRFFDARSWRVIFFDQRGAGMSKPFASVKNNTTPKLVSDIKKILDALEIKKVFLFGGSWGSTLALVFAIRYPERVYGMLLRGIFLGTEQEIKYMYGGEIKRFFPERWERFSALVPQKYRSDIISYYFRQMRSKDRRIRKEYADEWARYEISLLKLKNIPPDKIVFEDNSHVALSRLEAHYMKNNCFLPDNYILRHTDRIKKIPISIVQGRYDAVCPPLAAYKLRKKLENAKLFMVTAGHSSLESAIEKKLVSEMKRFSKMLP